MAADTYPPVAPGPARRAHGRPGAADVRAAVHRPGCTGGGKGCVPTRCPVRCAQSSLLSSTAHCSGDRRRSPRHPRPRGLCQGVQAGVGARQSPYALCCPALRLCTLTPRHCLPASLLSGSRSWLQWQDPHSPQHHRHCQHGVRAERGGGGPREPRHRGVRGGPQGRQVCVRRMPADWPTHTSHTHSYAHTHSLTLRPSVPDQWCCGRRQQAGGEPARRGGTPRAGASRRHCKSRRQAVGPNARAGARCGPRPCRIRAGGIRTEQGQQPTAPPPPPCPPRPTPPMRW